MYRHSSVLRLNREVTNEKLIYYYFRDVIMKNNTHSLIEKILPMNIISII